MAGPYVTAASILAHAGVETPTAADTAWADACADAIEATIAERLGDHTTSAGEDSMLLPAALQDGAACYVSRKSPHGVLSLGPDGDVVRLGRDIMRELEPVLMRIVGPGIG
jgi:hypothetical protein